MRHLDPNVSTPAVRQIADAIRDAINDGEIQRGDKIPPLAYLVEHFGVAKGTVDNAINTLKAEGILVGRQGAGIFVRTDMEDLKPAAPQPDVLASIDARLARIEQHLGITEPSEKQ